MRKLTQLHNATDKVITVGNIQVQPNTVGRRLHYKHIEDTLEKEGIPYYKKGGVYYAETNETS